MKAARSLAVITIFAVAFGSATNVIAKPSVVRTGVVEIKEGPVRGFTRAYEFADRTAPSYAPPVSFPYGAYHTGEIQYLFPLYHGAQGTPQPLNRAQERLSDAMVSYWTTFAEAGNPNSAATAQWPRYATGNGKFQSLRLPRAETRETSNLSSTHKCGFWGSLM